MSLWAGACGRAAASAAVAQISARAWTRPSTGSSDREGKALGSQSSWFAGPQSGTGSLVPQDLALGLELRPRHPWAPSWRTADRRASQPPSLCRPIPHRKSVPGPPMASASSGNTDRTKHNYQWSANVACPSGRRVVQTNGALIRGFGKSPLTPPKGPVRQKDEKQTVLVLRALWVSEGLVPSCQKHNKTNKKQPNP